MNQNKGQILVLFVILLPVLLIALLVGIELANLSITKIKTKNIIEEIITDNLKNYNETTNQTLNLLIEKNISDIEKKSIFTSEDEIRINITQKKSLFGKKIELKYNYKGIKKEDKIIVSEG